ncbi:MAG TPA: sugar transferase [Thermoleophilaceae bacterium]|nr:sugar transferase [Thermoleophilaceae bacterium]
MESSTATQAETSARFSRQSPAPAPLRASQGARQRSGVLSRRLLGADAVSGLAGGLVAGALMAATLPGVELFHIAAFALVAAICWPALSFVVGLYADDDLRFWVSGVSQAPRTLVTTILFAWPLFAVAHEIAMPHPGLTTIFGTVLTAVCSGLARATVRGVLHRSPELRQRVLIVGSGVVAGQLAMKLRTHEQFGLLPVGVLDDDLHPVGIAGLPWLGSLGDLRHVIDEQEIDRVIIAFTRASHHDLLECIRASQEKGIAVDVVPRLFELLDGGRALDRVGGLPLLSIGPARLGRASKIAKRALDVAVSSIALLVLLPLLVVLAIAIRVESKGPVVFRQRRVGRNGREFWLLKLRSMYQDADARKAEFAEQNDLDDGVMFKIHSDPRVTRVGRFLRRFSLDELPQLANVLKGDMSLVGPRPLIVPENDALTEAWHHRRLELRPGLTGAWQIYGRSENPFDEMIRFDYQYVAGWSLARDIEILLATMPAVLSGRGAY